MDTQEKINKKEEILTDLKELLPKIEGAINLLKSGKEDITVTKIKSIKKYVDDISSKDIILADFVRDVWKRLNKILNFLAYHQQIYAFHNLIGIKDKTMDLIRFLNENDNNEKL